ncbi:MAG: ATP-binding protein [Euzebya sp.]
MNVSLDVELPRCSRAIPVLRHSVVRLCAEIGVSPDDIQDLSLALAEACNNVVLHAHDDDSFAITFSLVDLTAKVVVRNSKTPYPAAVMDSAMGAVDPLSESGRGMAIMRALVDTARFAPGDGGGTLVELTRQVSASGGTLLADAAG